MSDRNSPSIEPHHEHGHLSKTPTGLGIEPLNIIVLGASFAGLSCAHHFLDYTINRLRITKAAPNYRLILISPSTHLYWNIGAPRALCSPNLMKHDDFFIPIEPGFHRHRGHNFTIIQGEAVGLDPSARTVLVELIGSTAQKRASQINKRASRTWSPTRTKDPSEKLQTMGYHALILATGSATHSELLSLHGPHFNTLGALNSFHSRVAAAKSIVVCGAGSSGVETAGQLATYLNFRAHWPVRRLVKSPKRITLITGSERCLPRHKEALGAKAEKILRGLGVEVKHGVRVIAAKEGFDLTGQTRIELSDDTHFIADVYIPCTGSDPNTRYVPKEMLDENRYVRTNARTLRVETLLAGSRVYAVGDVANYSDDCVPDVYTAVPVLMHNLLNDLLAHEYQLASPYGGNQDKIDDLVDEHFEQRSKDSELCPISRFGGVGLVLGNMLPSIMVHAFKGHDYRVGKAKKVVVDGGNPYAFKGKYE